MKKLKYIKAQRAFTYIAYFSIMRHAQLIFGLDFALSRGAVVLSQPIDRFETCFYHAAQVTLTDNNNSAESWIRSGIFLSVSRTSNSMRLTQNCDVIDSVHLEQQLWGKVNERAFNQYDRIRRGLLMGFGGKWGNFPQRWHFPCQSRAE